MFLYGKKKWYLETWFIAIMIALWCFIIPGIIGIILLIMQMKENRTLAPKLIDPNVLDSSITDKQEKLNKLNEEIKNLEQSKKQLSKDVEQEKNQLYKDLEQQKNSLNNEIKNKTKELDDLVSSYNIKQDELNANINNTKAMYDKLVKELSELEIKKEQLLNNTKQCENISIKNSNEDSSDIESYIVKDMIKISGIKKRTTPNVNEKIHKSVIGYNTLQAINSKFIAFDFETTGFNPENERIIEIGATVFQNKKPVETFSTLVNPEKNIPASATKVNHITDDMVKDAPVESVACKKFVEFLGDALKGEIILCAHNASFDIGFLKSMFERCNIDYKISYLDTLSLAKKHINGQDNNKLSTLAKHLNINNENSHRAYSDAKVCGEILLNIVSNIENERKDKLSNLTEDELSLCNYINSIILKECNNIKYLGFSKNASGYLDATCLYQFLRCKITKKNKYVIVEKEYAENNDINYSECSKSEGNANVRFLFNDMSDLDILHDYIYNNYQASCNKLISYINDGINTEEEIDSYLLNCYVVNS